MSNQPTPLRVALIGCGSRGRDHINALKLDPRLQIVAVADIKQEAATNAVKDYNLDAKTYTDHKALLAEIKPDVVVLTLWTALHLSVFQDCVDAGVKAVLSEKPVAATWGECQTIANLAKSSKTLLTYCHQRRFASGNRTVRKLLKGGVFGKIERMDLFSPPHLLDCGTHSMDQAMSFNEESPVKWVHGAADLSSTVSYFNIPAEGMFSGMLMFENGVFATIRTGRLDMDFWGGIRVMGDKGLIEVMWDGQIRKAIIYADPSWTPPTPDEKPDEAMIGTVKAAIDSLESGEPSEVDYTYAMRCTEPLFAFYESVKRHERIDLPLTGVTGNPLWDILETR